MLDKHESVQGSQYTSLAFGARCREAGVRPSMGSVGDAYDNALCESFFATLECELLERRRFRSQTEAVSRSSASSKPGTTRAGATPASAISLPLPMRRPTHARRSPPLQPMIGHRTDAARISDRRRRQGRACGAPLRGLRSLTATTARKQARHRFNAAVDARPNLRPKPSTKTGQAQAF